MVATGWQRFAEADWAGARDAFAAALEHDPGDPEALDRRREAYAAYQRRGDARRASSVAVYLAGEHRIDGRDAEASGWLARARRLLAAAGAVPELGWLAIEDAKRSRDPTAAERHCRDALAVAHAT